MLQIGLLWFDDSPQRTLNAKIAQAAQRYREKYGDLPNVCYVHPSSLGNAKGEDAGTQDGSPHLNFKGEHAIQILAARDVLPNHLWLGVTEHGPEPLN